jgi:hypothetical protein
MAILQWDNAGERYYETGVSNTVLYLAKRVYNPTTGTSVTYPKGVAWNGVTTISEAPEGADANDFYADNIKYLSIRGVENFKGSISAYTYPDEWMTCDGSINFANEALPGVFLHQQPRALFGLSYFTIKGNDYSDNIGSLIHLVYGATASPSNRDYGTVNDSPEPIEFSWDFDTTPVPVTGFENTIKPVSHITIDTTKLTGTLLTKLKNALWGTAEEDPYLPLPGDLYTLLTST